MKEVIRDDVYVKLGMLKTSSTVIIELQGLMARYEKIQLGTSILLSRDVFRIYRHSQYGLLNSYTGSFSLTTNVYPSDINELSFV